MTNSETYDWIQKEVIGRWPDAELTQAMKDDFYRGLYRVTADIATQAAIEHRADTQTKYPNAARICRIAQAAMKQAHPESEKKWQNVAIHRVYLGGCIGAYAKLNIGWRSVSHYAVSTLIDMEPTDFQCKLLDKERAHLIDHFGIDARFELFFNFVQAMKRSAEVWN